MIVKLFYCINFNHAHLCTFPSAGSSYTESRRSHSPGFKPVATGLSTMVIIQYVLDVLHSPAKTLADSNLLRRLEVKIPLHSRLLNCQGHLSTGIIHDQIFRGRSRLHNSFEA